MNLIVNIRNLLGSLRLQELLKSINPFEDEQMKEYFFVMLKPFNMNNIIPKITGLLTSLVVIINSEPHRMALLSKSYRYIGIGVANDKKWACVVFGVDYDSNNKYFKHTHSLQYHQRYIFFLFQLYIL